ncbi:MAG TPA: type II CAAX endopeptidase family protein [Candidatus Saccharimonadales bacterium]|nr:type II CAAX endopeptidase family protein [Candidatus Saccharimonadales bacterium]
MAGRKKRSNIAKWTFGVYFALMLTWTLAWVLKVNLDAQNDWLAASTGSFVYWTTAKAFIWIAPAIALMRLSGRSLREVCNFPNWKSWLKWGGGIGLLIALSGFIPKYLHNQPLFPTDISYALFSATIITPLFEEFLMRGAILGNLQYSYSFWKASILSSLMFLGLHLPGWFFLGTLTENLTKPAGGAISIFLLGLAFSYVVRRSKSFMGSAIAHSLNNLSSWR